MDDPGQIAGYAFAFRVGERVVISLVVIVLALVVSVAFWRSLQRVDFSVSREKLSAAGNVVLATPVFALLALIGLAWVSFSNPISVTVPGAGATADGDVDVAQGGGFKATAFVGPAAERADAAAMTRIAAAEWLRSLNCIAEAAGDLSPRETAALAELRLALMRQRWVAEWGDFAAFRAWALGESEAAPPDAARQAYAEAHPVC